MGERYYVVKGTVKVGELDLEELTRRGSSISLTVHSGDGKVGELTIGRGSITWKQGKRTKTRQWWDFSNLMLNGRVKH
jgi:hypothetical protein